MKEKDDNEETTPLKSSNINDLLEPLVNEEKPKSNLKKNLYKTYMPKIYTTENKNKNELHFKSINQDDKIKKIRSELDELNQETEESSNYSNTPPVEVLKCQNFIFIIILTIFSSMQFGIFVLVFNLYMNNTNNNVINNNNFTGNKFYLFFLVLSWKYQIYFIFYLIYSIFIFIKNKNKENSNLVNEDSIPFIKNNSINLFDFNATYNFRKFKYRYLLKYGSSYGSYLNIFFYTSNIFNFPENKNFFENFLNFEEIIKGICGIIFSYALFTGSYFFYFGVIYLIQSITAMIPYYIKFNFNSKNSNKNKNTSIISKINIKYIKFIFPILFAIGFYYLLKSIPNSNYNHLYILLILFISIITQIYSQKKFVQKSHNESPFHILFRTYFIFFLISNMTVLIIELVFNKLNIKNLFFWVSNVYLFLACFIGFGILGAFCYNMLLTFMRIALSNNVIVKLIKYFNFLIIDLVGIYLFRQYDIFNKVDYFMGIALCGISLFILDFGELLY